MPGAEGRTGWPWDALPWQLNWGFIILELSPFVLLIGTIILGVFSNRLRLFRRKRGAIVENFAGAATEAVQPLHWFLFAVYLIVGLVVIIYAVNNAIFGEQY